MARRPIPVCAAALALALGWAPAAAQDGGSQQDGAGTRAQQDGYTMPRNGMMGPGQGRMGPGMMGPGETPGQGQGPYRRGVPGQGAPGPGMMGPGWMMGPGAGRPGPGMMAPGMMRGRAAAARPTLRIETPGGLSFTCTADLQACLQAFDRVRAGATGDGN